MNKTEFIAAVAAKAEISKKDAEKAVKAFTDVVTEGLLVHLKLLRDLQEREETPRQARL